MLSRSNTQQPSSLHAALAQPAKRVYPAYPVMIRQLFKLMGSPEANLLHALVGVSGEVAELSQSLSRKNLLEEAGDLEFYLEAAKQHFTVPLENDWKSPLPGFAESVHLGTVMPRLVVLAGDMLDIAKKSWVYGKPCASIELELCIRAFEDNLSFVYELLGVTRDEVQLLNKVKLIGPGGRFESGFYSDEQAIARADKAGEEPAPSNGRAFFGKDAK